jgi:hypothetical protein
MCVLQQPFLVKNQREEESCDRGQKLIRITPAIGNQLKSNLCLGKIILYTLVRITG